MTSPLRKKKTTILNLRKSKHTENESSSIPCQVDDSGSHNNHTPTLTSCSNTVMEPIPSDSTTNTTNERRNVTLVSDDDDDNDDTNNDGDEIRTDENDNDRNEETLDKFELNPVMDSDMRMTNNRHDSVHHENFKHEEPEYMTTTHPTQFTTTNSSSSSSTPDETVPTTDTIFRKSILRTTQTSEDTQKRSVSFADDNNLPITTQRTISVSPNKLTRRVRRGKAENHSIPSAYESTSFLPEQNLIMGRVLVLLMDPPTKQYELTSVPYPLVSKDENHVGPTKLKDILKLVAGSASYEPLQKKTYQCFCRPDLGGGMDNEWTIMDYNFSKDEVLIGVPEGYKAEQCQAFAKPILEDKRLVKLLKKLKKHDRRFDRKKRFEKSLQLNMKHRTAESDRLENRNLEIYVNWYQLIAGLVAVICMAVLIGGGIGVAHKKSLKSELQILKKMEKDRQCKGRGIFGCKPFGLKHHDAHKPRIQMFQNAIKDISNWKLEGDDLML